MLAAQTAFDLAESREKAIKAGCNDYISKPIRQKKLMKVVEKYF